MKKGIHPTYEFANVSCACGMSYQTRTTVGDLKVDICSSCHPFFTGTQKIVDAEGRVEHSPLSSLITSFMAYAQTGC
jgi:large subunit ribosomal protein L31